MAIYPRVLFGDLDLTDAPYLIQRDSEDLGAPQNVYAAVQSQLQDGNVVAANSRDNREVSLTVLIDTSDLLQAAEAAAALHLEADKPRNTLTLDPGDGYGVESVFETFAAQLTQAPSDSLKTAGVQRWVLTIPALPYARSVTETTATALAPAESFGTTRQLRRTFEIGGSARTQAAIEVGGSTALGWSVVYTGYGEGQGAIPLRPHLTNSESAAVADASLLSGAYNSSSTNGNGVSFQLPASEVAPGTYLVMGMLKSSVARTTFPMYVGSWATVPGSGYNADLVASEGGTVYVDLGTTYTPTPLALINLPASRTIGASATLTILVLGQETGIDWQVDEVWLFNVDTGAVTAANLGTSASTADGASQRLWINPASVAEPLPSIIAGNAADGSDAFHLYRTYVQAWGAHSFPPGPVTLFTATAGATNTDASLRYFKRWHTHAAE